MTMQEAWSAITAVTPAERVRLGMMVGAGVESSWQAVKQYSGGPGVGAWQIEAGPGGSHYGAISEADALDYTKAARYMLASYQRASLEVGDADYASDPADAYATVAFRAERPARMYPEGRYRDVWGRVAAFLPTVGVTPPWGGSRPLVPLSAVYAEARKWIGTRDRSAYDSTNGDGTTYGFCEAFVESCNERAGVQRVRFVNALEFYLGYPEAPTLPLPAPPGAALVFGRETDPAGHIAVAAENGMMISTSHDGIILTPIWASCKGWQLYPGTMADLVTATPTTPPVVAPAGFVQIGNPYGAFAVHPLFVPRLQLLDTMGLALPQIGYAMEPAGAFATGRVYQRFERAVLSQGDGTAENHFDVVTLMLSEIPTANAAPAPGRR